MKVLGIESSSMTASVAIVTDDIVTAEYTTNFKQTHSQTLLPMIDEICDRTATNPQDIDMFAVSSGPGSFTGLRIGSATAKGLGMALDKPIIEVPTLDALAYNMAGAAGIICPVMDARRGNVYTGIYESETDTSGKVILTTHMPSLLVAIDELLEQLKQQLNNGIKVFLTGDGVAVNREKISAALSGLPYVLAPAHMAAPRAASVAALGMQYYRINKIQPVNAASHVPNYLRPSQAEREHAGNV